MMHLFLSPHLDDAILSCGGLIHQLTGRGESVLIRTYMTGDPQIVPDTPMVRDLHQRWDAGNNPMSARRAEDRAAAAVLGAKVEHIGFLDCPYRLNANGHALYTVNNDLFGGIHPHDPALQIPIDLPEDTQTVYAPLGAGGHVDHKIINLLGRQVSSVAVFFYEEYPYSAISGEAVRITGDDSAQIVGSEAVDIALAAFEGVLSSQFVELSEADLAAKIEAIACYGSQISTFWDDLAAMQASVRRYANDVDPAHSPGAERLWKETQ